MKKLSNMRPSAAAFLLMMAMAITTSALSFFVSPVCADLGIGRGNFTLYYSLMTVGGAISTSLLGQYINRHGVRRVILVSGLWSGCGLILFSFARALWMFYLVGVCMGLFATSCVNLCANVIVQQSYSSAQASGVLGFVMAGSGVGGMIFSLIIPNVIAQFGWRMGYRFLGLCWLVLVLSAFVLLGKTEMPGRIGGSGTAAAGMSRSEALHSSKFYLLMAALLLLTASCGIQQQLPSLLEGMEFSTAEVSLLVTVMTASLAVGKILQGVLYSKIGIVKGSVIMVLIFAVGFLLLMFKPMVYPALITLAFGMGVVTTLMPTAARFTFGARDFASIWSVLATASSAASFVATPAWGMIYDLTGSYTAGLIAAAVLTVAALAALQSVFHGQKLR